jgi:hypothetical protein
MLRTLPALAVWPADRQMSARQNGAAESAIKGVVCVDSLLLSCVDGRLRTSVRDLEVSLGIADGDRLLIPGGPLALVVAGPERDVAFGWIEMLVARKAVRRIVLVSHQHCLGYQRKLGGFFHDEREIIERDLAAAQRLLVDRFNAVRVECYVVPWRETRSAAGFEEAEAVDLSARR